MALIGPEDWEGLAEWAKDRPEIIRTLAYQFPPWKLYRLSERTGGQRVVIYSYSENGTMTVAVLGQYNRTKFERKVFGINPSDLTECDLPAPSEPLGVTMNEEQAEAFVKEMRRTTPCRSPDCAAKGPHFASEHDEVPTTPGEPGGSEQDRS